MTDQPLLPGLPQEPQLPADDPRTQLVQRVRAALMVLPGFFEFGTHFEGIDATDLFSLNSVLGASIEGQVVRTLNKMRNEWDPDEQWTGYKFVRQAQIRHPCAIRRSRPAGASSSRRTGAPAGPRLDYLSCWRVSREVAWYLSAAREY